MYYKYIVHIGFERFNKKRKIYHSNFYADIIQVEIIFCI